MKPVNIFLSLVLILMIAFGIFFYAGGTLQAQCATVSANTADYPEAFASIRNVIASDSAPQRFSGAIPDANGSYTLMDMNLTLTNRGIFDAEWLSITLNGTDGDIAVYSLTGQNSDIPARSSGTINLKLITEASAGAPRSISVQYYVFGISRSITVDL